MARNGLLRKPGLGLVLFVATISTGSIAWSADDALTATLQSRYAAMKAAIGAHDGTAIAAILAPDFTSVDVSGHAADASQMIAEVNGLKPDPYKSSETTLSSVIPSADAVTVEQRYDLKTVRIAADGARYSVELVTLSTDTWVKPAEVWLLERTVTNELLYFRNGQLVAHKLKPSGPGHG